MNKPKALIFYQYLPPWRIDVFNELGKYYNLTIVFTNANSEGFTYNREELLKKLKNIETIFLTKGFTIKGRPFRYGILRLIQKYKPDIIFSHEYSPTSIIIAFFKQFKIFHYKYYLTTSDNLKMAETSKGLKSKSRSYVLNHADGIIVYSNAVKEWYHKKFPNLKIEVCPNIQNPKTLLSYRETFKKYIDEYIERFQLRNYNIILYIGRLVKVKGLDLLLEAFAKAKVSNYKLVLVGDGNQKEDLQQLSNKLNLTDKVIFAGYYFGNSLYAWYDLANFFILPSRYEPFGAVINEALVYGCPVIASKYIGAIDFITSNNGKIFDPLIESDFIKTLEQGCDKYKRKREVPSNNLMPYSFEEYVKAFKTINS